MAIEWREGMSLGYSTIDDDHKRLIAMLNEFEASASVAMAEDTAKKLYRHAQQHFKREEDIQLLIRYPHHAEHRAEHEALLSQLRNIVKTRFVEKKHIEASVGEIHALLQKWLVDHVIKTDLKMKPYLGKV